jgi:hypothetical protein
MFAGAIVLSTFALAGWEMRVRATGYGPTYDDTPNLWAEQRELAIGATREQIVFVGASRTLFDMDLEAIRDELGGPLPIQLATVGSNCVGILADLAADPTYAGTTIVGVVPGLIAAGGGPPVATPKRYLDFYHRRSLADRSELELALFLEDRLAFINQDDLTLAALLENHLGLPAREGVYAPDLPDYMYTLDRNRQADLVGGDDAEAMAAIQQVWLPLMGGPPKPDVFTDDQWAKLLEDGWLANLASLVASVEAIEGRGGAVIFSRLPSSGGVLEIEEATMPREKIWDRILEETGAPGVYFSDHPELARFECPEWSHLDPADATEYSRQFARILRAEGLI